MNRTWISAANLAGALMCATASSQAGVLVLIPPVPGSTFTQIQAINNNNVIAGFYGSSADSRFYGFVGGLDGNYATFADKYGGAVVEGLNDDGYIVGHSDMSNNDCYTSGYGCQFLRNPEGTIREITKGKMSLDGMPGEITNSGKFVGVYLYRDSNGVLQGGPYYGKYAKYVSDLMLPLGGHPRGLSKSGAITGWNIDENDSEEGFVFQGGVQAYYKYPDQNAFYTDFEKLSDHGMVAGEWSDQNSTYSRAFLFDIRKSRFKPIDTPGGTYAYATSVNNAGIATVSVDNASYIYCPHKKTCPITDGAIEVPDRWISVHPVKVARICEHDCVDKPGRPTPVTPAELARMRATAERQRHLLFRQ